LIDLIEAQPGACLDSMVAINPPISATRAIHLMERFGGKQVETNRCNDDINLDQPDSLRTGTGTGRRIASAGQ
jgi:hypothetical protein